jgi:hypothetical protein
MSKPTNLDIATSIPPQRPEAWNFNKLARQEGFGPLMAEVKEDGYWARLVTGFKGPPAMVGHHIDKQTGKLKQYVLPHDILHQWIGSIPPVLEDKWAKRCIEGELIFPDKACSDVITGIKEGGRELQLKVHTLRSFTEDNKPVVASHGDAVALILNYWPRECWCTYLPLPETVTEVGLRSLHKGHSYVKGKQIEGFVIKNASNTFWMKWVKTYTLDVAVGATIVATQGVNRGQPIGFDTYMFCPADNEYVYTGRVVSGLSHTERKQLRSVHRPKVARLTCKGRTRQGKMRNACFLNFRKDKNQEQCLLSQLDTVRDERA